MNLDRLECLVGLSNIVKIKNLNVLIVGIGGVGGYTLESLIRCGVNNITLIDGDVIDETNLNRQIISTSINIGEVKVNEARKRALLINPNVNVQVFDKFLNESNIDDINFGVYDYVVDSCDSVNTKVLLINKCLEYGVKIISSMGTAKKMDATKLTISTLDKTSYDPLAKKMRKLIDKEKQKNVVVISSSEEVICTQKLGSNSYVPAIAGLLITNYIINNTIK